MTTFFQTVAVAFAMFSAIPMPQFDWNEKNMRYTVWGGPSLSDFIKSKYGISYGVRACQKLMHKMGFSFIRPQIYPSLENPDSEARENFKKTE